MSARDEGVRETGQTTGLMLKALGDALLARGEWVPFEDHTKHGGVIRQLWKDRLKEMVSRLGLDVDVRVSGTGLYVRSLKVGYVRHPDYFGVVEVPPLPESVLP